MTSRPSHVEHERTGDSAMDTLSESEIEISKRDLLERLERVEDELQTERERRRRLESVIEIRGAESADEADLPNVWIAGNPAGKFIKDNKVHRKKSQSVIFGIENGIPEDGPSLQDIEQQVAESGSVYTNMDGQDSSEGQTRELPFPLYRMLADLQDGQDAALDKSQRRAARIFERFVNKAKGVEGSQNVSKDGQKYTMMTDQAIEVLEDEGLLDVKEQSKSRIAGRVMREVQRFTIVDTESHEECDCIDGCSDHGVIHFRPGKPHSLTVRKGQMKGVVRNASPSDKDVRTSDDGESGRNSPEEGSADKEFDKLSKATQVTPDD